MSAGRFFVAPEVLADPARVVLPPGIAAQVHTVLRLGVGDTITLLDGSGLEITVRLMMIDRAQILGEVIARSPVMTEPRAQVSLYVGMLKATRFEWVIQKGTEIGVQRFVPLVTARTMGGLGEASPAKRERWHTIATEAAEQSERGSVPTIAPPITFEQALQDLPPGEPVLLAWEDRRDKRRQRVADVLEPLPDRVGMGYHLFIGPEGGFTAAEVEHASACGIRLVTLGLRTLRAETAAIVLATLTLDALGE